MAESDDEVPTLPADTLAILQQFQKERFEELRRLEGSDENPNGQSDDIEIGEDWQLSQFWYDDETAATLAKEAVRCAGDNGKIALISCPTLYRPLMKLKGQNCEVRLLEFDKRFSIYGNNFVFYDYNAPLELPADFAKAFDLVIADPPFLSAECLSKVASTIQHLSKNKIILCTGTVMENLVADVLQLKKTKFMPRHKNNLGNEFGCFSNYEMISYNEDESTNVS